MTEQFTPPMVPAQRTTFTPDNAALIKMPGCFSDDRIVAIPVTSFRKQELWNRLNAEAFAPRPFDPNAQHPSGAPLSPTVPHPDRMIVAMTDGRLRDTSNPAGPLKGSDLTTRAYRVETDSPAYSTLLDPFLRSAWVPAGWLLLQHAWGNVTNATELDYQAAQDAYERYAHNPHHAGHQVFFARVEIEDRHLGTPAGKNTRLVATLFLPDRNSEQCAILHFGPANHAPIPDVSGWSHNPGDLANNWHPAAFGMDMNQRYIRNTARDCQAAINAHGTIKTSMPTLRHLVSDPLQRAVEFGNAQRDIAQQEQMGVLGNISAKLD